MLHSMLLKYYLLHYFSVVCYHDGVLYLFVSSRNFYTVIQLVEKLNFSMAPVIQQKWAFGFRLQV